MGKKINQLILCLVALLSILNQVYSQEIKPLTVGDKMPDIVLKSLINYSKSSAKISDFKGKALILDFWFIACGSCREAMPHLDSLQKVFKSDLQLLLVTWEDKKKVENFFETDLNARKLKFVNVVNDTILRKYFPASGFPHQIWIDKNYRISAITDGSNTSVENIQNLVDTKTIDLPVKVDEMDKELATGTNPLMTYRYEGTKNKILKYSYLSQARLEFRGGTSQRVDTVNKIVRVSFRNVDFLALYDRAYSTPFGSTGLHKSTRIIRRDSSSVKTQPDYKTFTNVFCYDLMYKDTVAFGTFGKFMIQDLDNYFGVNSHEEIKKLKCMIIREKGSGKVYLKSMDGNEKKFLDDRLIIGKTFRSNKIWKSSVETNLNNNNYMPIILELDCDQYQPVSFAFTWTPDNIKLMSMELGKFGLEMVIEKRPRKVIILENN
jgi:thiol-disulfide isomerase/thioredoxin